MFAERLLPCASSAAAASRVHVSGGGGPARRVLIRALRHHQGGALSRPVLVTRQGARSIFSWLPGRFVQALWGGSASRLRIGLCKATLPQPILSGYANFPQSPAIKQGKFSSAGPGAGEGARWLRGPSWPPSDTHGKKIHYCTWKTGK